MEIFRKILSFIATWITSLITIGIGVFALYKLQASNNPIEQYKSNIVIMFLIIIIAYLFNYIWFSYITNQKLTETHSKIDDLKKSVETSNVTADNFFITRKEKDKEEDFASIVQSKPKTINYSGGNLNNLISEMMESQCFKQYIIENSDVNVKFLFPDPENEEVISNLVNNITLGNEKETYKADINNALKKLNKFIKDNALSSRVEYRFYEFVPSFGLKTIAGGNNERLYVDLYTIKVVKENRYQFKIEKTNSQNSYLLFENQYNELWKISRIPT